MTGEPPKNSLVDHHEFREFIHAAPLVGGMAHFQSQINGLVKGNFMKLPYFIAQKKTWFPVGVPKNQSHIYIYYYT